MKAGPSENTASKAPICIPSVDFDHCFEVSVFIKASPETLWEYLGSIEKLSEFFPNLEFKRDAKGPLHVAETYYSKLSIDKQWTGYKIICVEENRRISAEQIGRYRFIKKMKYDHYLISTEGGTLSTEKVEYSLSFGPFSNMLNSLLVGRLLKKTTLMAHQKLKERGETKSVFGGAS